MKRNKILMLGLALYVPALLAVNTVFAASPATLTQNEVFNSHQAMDFNSVTMYQDFKIPVNYSGGQGAIYFAPASAACSGYNIFSVDTSDFNNFYASIVSTLDGTTGMGVNFNGVYCPIAKYSDIPTGIYNVVNYDAAVEYGSDNCANDILGNNFSAGGVSFAALQSACVPYISTYHITYSSFTISKSTITAGSAGSIPFPETFSPTLTADMSSQFGDKGTLEVLAIAAGIPLAFYVFHELIGLIPSVKNRRKKYGDFR